MKQRIFLSTICILFLSASMSFGYQVTFSPRLSVQGEYTDNIFLTENSDLKKDDVITTITPGFTAELVGSKGDAKISYDPSYAFYDEFDEFNGWRHEVEFSGKYMTAKKTRFDMRDNFVYTEDPIKDENLAEERTEDPENPIDSTVRKSRRVFYRNFAKVGLTHQFGKYHSFRVGYRHLLRDDEDPTYEDKQYHNPSAGLEYWFGPKWGFEIDGDYARGQFELSEDVDIFRGGVSLLKRFGKHFIGHIRYTHVVVDYDEGENDDQTYIPSIGFDYDVAKDISVKLDAGYYHNDYKLRKDTDAFNGSLRLIKKFERGKINLSALGGFDYSFFGAEKLGFNQFYEGAMSGNYQFAKFVNGRIYGSYRNTEYTDQSDREDKRTTIGAGLKWRVLEWMTIGLDYSFRNMNSTVEANDYDENRVKATVTIFPTVPFHTSRY